MSPVTGVAFGLPAVLVAGLLGAIMMFPGTSCSTPGTSVDASQLPAEVGNYSGEQLANAAAIINAGSALGISAHGQTIAVMTAMGESGLRVLDYGDEAGPDSRGLFQQRDSWGTLAERMNPTASATFFYQRLITVDGWEAMEPTLAAHRTQINADPYHYEKYWTGAQQVMGALGASGAACQSGPPGAVNAQGWAVPAAGSISDSFGPREVICAGGYCSKGYHSGTDLDAACDAPIYAARGGIVTSAGPNGSYGNYIQLSHGDGIATGYAHMYADGVFVSVGQSVLAGQHIGNVGDAGVATGCHLHFEVRQDNVQIDPEPFMAAVGATLGQ